MSFAPGFEHCFHACALVGLKFGIASSETHEAAQPASAIKSYFILYTCRARFLPAAVVLLNLRLTPAQRCKNARSQTRPTHIKQQWSIRSREPGIHIPHYPTSTPRRSCYRGVASFSDPCQGPCYLLLHKNGCMLNPCLDSLKPLDPKP